MRTHRNIFDRNCRTRSDVWHGALSWRRMKPFAHFSGRFQRTYFLKRSNKPLQHSELTVVFLGTNSARTMPWRSKNTIIITFVLDLENLVISIKDSEPWSQDHNHTPKFYLPWWNFLKSWNLKQHDRQLQWNWQKLLRLSDRRNTRNKFRTHTMSKSVVKMFWTRS